MKKTILYLGIVCTLLQGCSYKPILDSNGRSGTFNKTTAENITNDLILCKKLAKQNTNFVTNISYWALSPTMDTKFESIYRKCLQGRGHSILN